jgi:selenoprotein W-related protein
LTEALLREYGSRISAVTLVPSSGGVFEVAIDGTNVFSKMETDRFPTIEEIGAALRDRLS